MKYTKVAALILSTFMINACSDYSLFKPYAKSPEGLEKIALLMEEGNAGEAKQLILQQLPAASQLILNQNVTTNDLTYSATLASSMINIENGANQLSMFANADAQANGVQTLNILVEINKIDSETKAEQAGLQLDADDDAKAIATFHPAMPKSCASDSSLVEGVLDRDMAVILATGILRGFNAEDIETKIDELRASLTKPDMFNNFIFSQVAFICPTLQLDANQDTKFSTEEVQASVWPDEKAENLYKRIEIGIASVAALSAVNPTDQNITNALNRMNLYKKKIDEVTSVVSIADKMRAFLVSQSAGRP